MTVRIKPSASTCLQTTTHSLSVEGQDFSFPIISRHDDNAKVFETLARMMNLFKSGYSATLLAYGQTGSGKTHTMIGAHEESPLNAIPPQWGLFPRVAASILVSHSTLFFSAIEVYKEDAFDLLNHRAILSLKPTLGHKLKVPGVESPIKTRDNDVHPSSCYCRICYNARNKIKALSTNQKQDQGSFDKGKTRHDEFSVCGETLIQIKSLADIAQALKRINVERTSHSHNLNSHSSRSHCIMTLQIKDGQQKFVLVDLAGSERVTKSGVVALAKAQAVSINASLSALGRVIIALGNGSGHVPFRDSSLTMLLSSALRGKSINGAIICVSEDPIHSDETVCSLKFGERMKVAKSIVSAQVSTSNKQDSILMRQKLQYLKSVIDESMAGHFGPGVPLTEQKTFLENQRLLETLDKELLQLKEDASESGLASTLIAERTLRRNNVRDILLRQKSIHGFWIPPTNQYTQISNEIKDLENKLSLYSA